MSKIALIFCDGPQTNNLKYIVPDLIKLFSRKMNPDFTSIGVNEFCFNFIKQYMPKSKLEFLRIDNLVCDRQTHSLITSEQFKVKGMGKQKFIVSEDIECLEITNNCDTLELRACELFINNGYDVVMLGLDTASETEKDLITSLKLKGNIYKVDSNLDLDIPTVNLECLMRGIIMDITEQVPTETDINELSESSQDIIANIEEIEIIDVVESSIDDIVEQGNQESVEDVISNLQDGIIETILMQLPINHCDGVSLSIGEDTYEIVDRLINVHPNHVVNLANQGFNKV